MTRTPVRSSAIVSIGHDAATDTLEVEMASGTIYHYSGVSPEDHEALMQAPSIGKHFAQHIRTGFKGSKVT